MLRRTVSNSVWKKPFAKEVVPSREKPISAWEALFDPFRQTSQERWLYEECVARLHTKSVIVSNFRGCGKSTTLKRLQFRWFLYPRLWLTRRIEFYDGDTADRAVDPTWVDLAARGASFMFMFSLSTFIALTGLWFSRPEDDDSKRSLSVATVRDVVKEQLPTKEGAFLAISVATIQLLFFCRRRVLILDDVSGTKSRLRKKFPANGSLLSALNVLSGSANVIFVSSHEMMRVQFPDASASSYTELRMPPLTAQEMELRLVRMGFDIRSALSEDGKPSVDGDESPFDAKESPLGVVMKMYGLQLAYSARFYIFAKLDGILLRKPTRAQLRKICLGISLEAADKRAICCSSMVNVSTLEHFPLQGCINPGAVAEKKNAVQYFEEAFPGIKMVPHRLVIPMILAATSHVSNAPESDMQMYTNILEKLPEAGSWNKLEIPSDAANAVSGLRGKLQLTRWTFEVNYFRSSLNEANQLIFDDILSKYDIDKTGGISVHARMFVLRREDILNALREKYVGGTQACEERICAFEAWLGRERV